jgi:hypothetical protein
MDWINNPDYCGQILNGQYSPKLKKRVKQCLSIYSRFEATGNPSMCYLAAWQEHDRIIWYEFTSGRLRELLRCNASEVAAVFREGVVEQRIYKYQEQESGVTKDIIDQEELIRTRKQLRQKVKKAGIIEAVYKIALPNNRPIWLKDQAKIEIYYEDRTCISNGCLTVISKEMVFEEERERVEKELLEILSMLSKAT